MTQLVDFKAEDLFWLKEYGGPVWIPESLTVADFRYLEGSRFAKSLKTDDGQVLMCVGATPLWANRATAWAFMNQKAGSTLLRCHRVILRFFDICPYQRVEATVDCDFEAGHRWLKLLGFTLEAPRMRCYSPYGADQALYARIQMETP